MLFIIATSGRDTVGCGTIHWFDVTRWALRLVVASDASAGPPSDGSPNSPDPHRRALVAFLILSVAAAVLTVATPVLAGQIVEEIIKRRDASRVVVLASVIAGIALLDAVVGIAERWQSSKIGEGLILDLRRAVFGHVQRMPVAFFTRTRTDALVTG